ncbi:MAG: hypothetical protein J0H29_25205 [Sphingobacteriales bacterium]|nr:hypothetical protein [Sphingobacteriales bacterium]
MNKLIIVFNIIYYVIIFILIKLGRDDSSSSLGYGIFIIIFWSIAGGVLIFLLTKKIIRPKSLLDKIGIFTATPLLTIVFVMFFRMSKENVSSEWYFNKENYRYKVREINYGDGVGIERIEFYRSADTINSPNTSKKNLWVKDSTWIYLSKTGDTIKKVVYKNDVEIK